MLFLHILAGVAALVAGATALAAAKGGGLHRRSGMVFVSTMLFMSSTGALMAVLKVQRISVVAGLLTFYLVATALLTVRRRQRESRWMDAASLLMAVAVSVAGFTLGFKALHSAGGTLDGLPPPPAFMFGTVALLAAVGDARVLRSGGLQGARRIARHLWRMCFALFIATASFFLGQAKLFPRGLRSPALLATPVLAVLLMMAYWMVRVRMRPRYQA